MPSLRQSLCDNVEGGNNELSGSFLPEENAPLLEEMESLRKQVALLTQENQNINEILELRKEELHQLKTNYQEYISGKYFMLC